MYDICSARNLTQLATQHYFHHEQIQNFNPEQVKNKFYAYSDRLLVNLKLLQQEMVKIANANAAIAETRDFISKKIDAPVKDDVAREIFHYLSPKESKIMHVAANPNDLFRYKPELFEKNDLHDKNTRSCCCIL